MSGRASDLGMIGSMFDPWPRPTSKQGKVCSIPIPAAFFP